MSETTPIPVLDPTTEGLDTAAEAALAEQQHLQELAKSLHIEVLDVSRTAVEAKAIDHGDAYIAEQTSQHGFKGLMKRVWTGNIAHDYIRQREVQRGRNTIVEEGNSFALSGGTKDQHDAAMGAVVNRFTEGLLSEGESSHELDDSEPSQNLRTGIQELVRGFASGSVSLEGLEEDKTRLLSDYGRTLRAEDRNKGLLFANNITEVAIAAKAAWTHGLALDKIDQLLSINSGEARTGVRTEARQTATDKIVNTLYSTKAGAMVNETTIALAVGTFMTISKFTTRKVATAVGAFVGLGVGAGLIAGARAHAKFGQDRQLHHRQMATSGEMPAAGSAKYREKIEETRYDTARASDLYDQLAQARAAVNEADPATQQELVNIVAEIATRIRLSDEESKDLIQYDNETTVEQERLAMAIQLDEAKLQLMRSGVSAATISESASSVAELLRSDISDKDRVFAKMQRQETMKMAAVGFISGMVIGDSIQEVKAAFSDDLQGVFEGDSSNQDRRTLLAGIFSSHHHTVANHLATAGHETALNKDLSVGLPPDYHMQGTSAGHYELVGPDAKPLVGNITLNSHGQIDPASLAALHNAGVNINSHSESYTTSRRVFEKSTRTPAEYMNAHPDQFTNIHRELWYNNDTTIFDKNELRLDWGGQGGSGMDAHGNYQFDVKSMFPAGSFHEGAHTDAQQLLSSGKMAIALSLDKSAQAHVMMIHVGANGIATIKADSWEARSLFENRNGQAHFVGGYAEAVQLMGHNPNGGESVRMLATVVGDNHPKPAVDTISHIVTTQHERTIMDMNVAEKGDLPIEIPFPVPLYGRRGLEKLKNSNENSIDSPDNGYYGGYYGAALQERRAEWAQELSPRLVEDPSADLDTGTELADYRQRQGEKRGEGYLAEVDNYIAQNENLKNIGDETKALVCIPVAAASEADNIYKTLSLYAQQSEESKKSTVVLLNVNWLQAIEGDPEKMDRVRKTHEEIERARADFPDVRIASFDKVWSADFIEERTIYNSKGKPEVRLFGEVIKVLYDTAALAVGQAVTDGKRKTASEAMIITNDADAQGLTRQYLDRYISSLEKNPTVDVFAGLIRWGTREYVDYPGYGLSAGFYAVMNIATQRPGANRTALSTTGPNAGFRLSAYAATGGCEDRKDQGAGADAILGQRVSDARKGLSPSNRSGKQGYGYGSATISSSSTSAVPLSTPQKDRMISMHVGGAQIDTLADRLLGAYKAGDWIASGWNGFDGGEGYQDRTDVAKNAPALKAENAKKDIDSISTRVETNVSGFVNGWYRDAATATSAIALYFGTKDKQGRPLYTTRWDGKSGWEGSGTFHFEFTKEGKAWLQDRLLKDSSGKRDPYGMRVRQQIYGRRQVAPNTLFVAPS